MNETADSRQQAAGSEEVLPGLEAPPPVPDEWLEESPHSGGWLCYSDAHGECVYCGVGSSRDAAWRHMLSEAGLDDADEAREDAQFLHLPAGLDPKWTPYELFVLTGEPFQHGFTIDMDSEIHDAEDLALALLEADSTATYGFWNTGENDYLQRRLLYGADALREIGEKLFPSLWTDAQTLIAEKSNA